MDFFDVAALQLNKKYPIIIVIDLSTTDVQLGAKPQTQKSSDLHVIIKTVTAAVLIVQLQSHTKK